MSTEYTPEQIAEELNRITELVDDEHGPCTCREEEVEALKMSREIIEQLRAENAALRSDYAQLSDRLNECHEVLSAQSQ